MSEPAKRARVPKKIRQQLVAEAGNKCANPGCSSWRTHLHHIDQWHIYRTHNADAMIAICPTCHDHVHFGGRLTIDDDTLRRWKTIPASGALSEALLYVMPVTSGPVRVLLGSIAVQTTGNQLTLFRFGNGSTLSMQVLKQRHFRVSASLLDAADIEVVEVLENHVTVLPNSDTEFNSRPGRILVTAPNTDRHLPSWMRNQLAKVAPSLNTAPRVTMLDLHVVEPGLVDVRGIWLGGDCGIAVLQNGVNACKESAGSLPISLVGKGKDTRFVTAGPAEVPLLGFGVGSGATLHF